MNSVLPSRFVERIQRLALGIEPIDAARDKRFAHTLVVMLDGPWPPTAKRMRPPRRFRGDYEWSLPLVERHDSCVHALLYRPDIEGLDEVELRLFDRGRRFVPRRIRYPLVSKTPEDADDFKLEARARRPVLFPGAAYNVQGMATGLRGRVVRNGGPVMWARVEAERVVNHRRLLVGRAHGDDRGEFLLLLGTLGSDDAVLAPEIKVEVTVYGPEPALPKAPPQASDDDPLWGLPIEIAPSAPSADTVSSGVERPPLYSPGRAVTRTVPFTPGRLLSWEENFDLT